MTRKINDVRLENLDKFYTKKEISKKCIDKVFEIFNEIDYIIEPSAGNGSFFLQLPNEINKIGIDIKPEHRDIIEMDFFKYLPPTNKNKILIIGNPPFGKVNSLSIKFFNHSAKFCNIIAFIIPKTFRKVSIQNKLDLNFHLIYDMDLPLNPCCFEPKMMVKCCFQIWEKKDLSRNKIELPTIHNDWNFIPYGKKDEKGQPTPPNNVDFAMRAYGGNIGEIKLDNLNNLRPKSWHWIKSNIDVNLLINRFKQLDYSKSINTARQNSIGKAELIELYTNFINSKL